MQDLWDHPRRCGENNDDGSLTADSTGSPPQVRGKHDDFIQIYDRLRITPAGAGKTLFETFPRVIVQDHPRRCGENSLRPT